MTLTVPCLFGLESLVADEMRRLDLKNVQAENGRVHCEGTLADIARLNINLRCGARVLMELGSFPARDFEALFQGVYALPWEDYIPRDGEFPVKGYSLNSQLHSVPACQSIVKKASAKRLGEKYGVETLPESGSRYQIQFSIIKDVATLYLDTSGEGLYKRGYRAKNMGAPLRETLAAALVTLSRYRGKDPFCDPFCGSGTIPIEAALIARNIAPGVFRKEFAFEKWVDFDQELFDTIYNDDSQEREFTHKIYGYDNSPNANEIAMRNIKAAGVSKDVVLKLQPFQQFEQPAEKSILITNPPYGERISTNNLLGLYTMIGERLKHAFAGNTAWILSYREECFDQIGLKPTRKIPLFNGALECEFRQYEIFDGKYKEFREAGDELSKERREYTSAAGERPERRDFRSGERRDFRPRPRRDARDGENRDFRPRERKYGEEDNRDFRPRERRYGDDDNRDFRPRERREFGEDRRPRPESYPERKRREAGRQEEE